MGRTLRLGTRRSTLAWAQSAWVARQLQTLDPTITVELVPIETRGDRITNVPLREIEGKDFFTAELDASLLDGRVDLSVHSLKDLSLDRPPGIRLGAIPKRKNPRDVIVFGADAQQKLAAGQSLRIGTSAPRRLENVPKFLSAALPSAGGSTSRCAFVEIRGNVDTRLSRLHEPQDSERRLEGVVLAFAGLIRLWNDTTGRERLQRLLRDTRWMVLPIVECPAAPGQGALAVECRTDDAPTFALLQKLHDLPSAVQIERERAVLARFGGGCHQKFGATCIQHPQVGGVLYIRGKDATGKDLDQSEWLAAPAPFNGPVVPWDGSKQTPAAQARPADANDTGVDRIAASAAPVFIAHHRALPPGAQAALANRRVWTSGIASWKKLAERGVWVEGCADTLGFEWIVPTLQEPVLGLPALDRWQVLTHANATASWPTGEAIATYTSPHDDSGQILDVGTVTHAFWASGSQFRSLSAQLPRTVHHACGPGKTADSIRAAGILNLTVFPSVEEWRRWLRIL